jgi:hypothetical protein
MPRYRPVINGGFSDWSDEYVVARSIPPSRPGDVGVKTLSAIKSGSELFICVELDRSINLQGGNDQEPGLVVTLGSETRNDFRMDFKNKFPANISGGSAGEFIEWTSCRFECLPTYASDRFEMKLQALNEKYPGRKVYREGDRIVVRIPVQFQRRNGRQMIVAAGEESQAGPDDNALAVAIARAWQWQEELETGDYASIEDLARAKKVDRTYASRILKLTSLAPEIVEAVLAGEDLAGLSLRQLRKGIPLLWREQRQNYGFDFARGR